MKKKNGPKKRGKFANRVGWKKCVFIWAFMKFAWNIHPTCLFGPTLFFGTWEYSSVRNRRPCTFIFFALFCNSEKKYVCMYNRFIRSYTNRFLRQFQSCIPYLEQSSIWNTRVDELVIDAWVLGLKDISTPDFSTPSFNPIPFNPGLFNYELFNPKAKMNFSTPDFSTMNFSTPDFSTPYFSTPSLGLKNPGLKSSWLKSPGLKGLGLKCSGLKCPLLNVWGWKVRGWNILSLLA